MRQATAARADERRAAPHEPVERATARRVEPPLLRLQQQAGNQAVRRLLRSRPGPAVQRSACACGCAGTCGAGHPEQDDEVASARPSVWRRVDPALSEAIDAGRYAGSPTLAPPLRPVMQIFEDLSAADRRDTFRALTAAQQLSFVSHAGSRRDGETWRVVAETGTQETRTFVVRSFLSSGHLLASEPPWGALGLVNGLSDADQVAVLVRLSPAERRTIREGLASAPVDRERIVRSLTAVDADLNAPTYPVAFPLTWVAEELAPPARAIATAAGASSYMGSQGAHAWGGTPVDNGLRMIGTRYWRALVPAQRAIELLRALDELPRDLDSQLTSMLARTPPGTRPAGLDSRFTVDELRSIPDLVRRFNTDKGASLAPAELALIRRTLAMHVDGAMRSGSPWVSWSVPHKPGEPDPVPWAAEKRFRVRAEFDPKDVLDNTRASPANRLAPEDNALGFWQEPLNPGEAEFLAVAAEDARVVTVFPHGAVKGELVAGSTRWMAQNASTLRWAGRGLLLVSFAISGARIASADSAHRSRVIGEEAGAQFLGLGGAVLVGAACVSIGLATGGVGLVLCGMAGGLAGAWAGSKVGGMAADQITAATATNDPFGITTAKATGQPGQPGEQRGRLPTGDTMGIEILPY